MSATAAKVIDLADKSSIADGRLSPPVDTQSKYQTRKQHVPPTNVSRTSAPASMAIAFSKESSIADGTVSAPVSAPTKYQTHIQTTPPHNISRMSSSMTSKLINENTEKQRIRFNDNLIKPLEKIDVFRDVQHPDDSIGKPNPAAERVSTGTAPKKPGVQPQGQ